MNSSYFSLILFQTSGPILNSQDRVIPIRTTHQAIILKELLMISPTESLISSHGYDTVRHAYRKGLVSVQLPPRSSYRYLYAQTLHQSLSSTLRNYELTLLLMREMGLQTRVTLWGYLHESY